MIENVLTCDDCKETALDVKETTCPYAEDIHAERIDVKLCDNCYELRCDEI